VVSVAADPLSSRSYRSRFSASLKNAVYTNQLAGTA
jgi:hypothetical protein